MKHILSAVLPEKLSTHELYMCNSRVCMDVHRHIHFYKMNVQNEAFQSIIYDLIQLREQVDILYLVIALKSVLAYTVSHNALYRRSRVPRRIFPVTCPCVRQNSPSFIRQVVPSQKLTCQLWKQVQRAKYGELLLIQN